MGRHVETVAEAATVPSTASSKETTETDIEEENAIDWTDRVRSAKRVKRLGKTVHETVVVAGCAEGSV